MASDPSPTPSEDNHLNKLQDCTSKALDAIMANTEKSYDDFVNDFTYLKKGDALTQKKNPPKPNFLGKKTVNAPIKGSPSPLDSKVSSVNKDKSSERNERRQDGHSQEELETEILGEGEVTSRLSQSKMIKTGAAVKVDNFVEEDDLDTDEDLEEVSTAGYMASFNADSNQLDTRASRSTNQSSDQDATDIADAFSGQLSLDENSTDKLLLNFLADLQNETNENLPVRNPDQSDSSMDIQSFLNKNKKSFEDENQTKETLESEDVTFSDEDTDTAATNLLDNSDQGNVKVVVKQEELADIEQSKKQKSSVQTEEIMFDSEGVRIVQEKYSSPQPLSHSQPHSQKEDVQPLSENEAKAKNMVFPGEIEDMKEELGTRHNSLLDFKATYREPADVGGGGESSQGECSDSVEPFSLDADFDYDNVVLTPKFSQTDLQKLQTVISQPS